MRRLTTLTLIVTVIVISLTICPASAFRPPDVQMNVERLKKTNQCAYCDLTGADLSSWNLYGAALFRAKLTGAKLYRTNLSGADLQEANLSGVNLTNAILAGAWLQSSNLTGANLTGADLFRAEMYNTKLSGATLSGAIWTDGSRCREGSIGECKK